MEFAAELQTSLQEFTASGIVEVHENGGRVATFSGMSWEVRGAGEMPLLHLWSEQFNLTRRVLAITDYSERRLALAVERFGRSKPDRLEFIRRDVERSASELSRAEFLKSTFFASSKCIVTRSPAIPAILFTARKPNAGWHPLFARMSPAWMPRSIRDSSMLKFLPTTAANTGFSISSPSSN